MEARNRIVAFHNAYVRRLEARASGMPEDAHRITMEMADMSLAVQRDLDKVNQGTITLVDAPAMGGRRRPAPLVQVVLTDLEEQYNIKPNMVQVMLRQAVSEHERLAMQPPIAVAGRHLMRGVSFLVMLPVHGLAAALGVIRRHRVLGTAGGLLGTAASVFVILQALGVI